MAKEEDRSKARLISLILRATIIVLFGGVAMIKWINGPGHYVTDIQNMFGPSGFPHWIVTTYAWAMIFIESLIGIWLIAGWRLKAAWFVTGLYVTTLVFGMLVVGNIQAVMVYSLVMLFPLIGFRVSHADSLHA